MLRFYCKHDLYIHPTCVIPIFANNNKHMYVNDTLHAEVEVEVRVSISISISINISISIGIQKVKVVDSFS